MDKDLIIKYFENLSANMQYDLEIFLRAEIGCKSLDLRNFIVFISSNSELSVSRFIDTLYLLNVLAKENITDFSKANLVINKHFSQLKLY